MPKKYDPYGEGQIYNVYSPLLKRYRFAARDGLTKLSKTERHAYGAAVEAAVLSSQRAALHRESTPQKSNCASGTFHNTGAAIHEAIRAQHRAALERLAAKDRAKHLRRGVCQWFLYCENPATTTVPHPTLGTVPCCERCAKRASA